MTHFGYDHEANTKKSEYQSDHRENIPNVRQGNGLRIASILHMVPNRCINTINLMTFGLRLVVLGLTTDKQGDDSEKNRNWIKGEFHFKPVMT